MEINAESTFLITIDFAKMRLEMKNWWNGIGLPIALVIELELWASRGAGHDQIKQEPFTDLSQRGFSIQKGAAMMIAIGRET